MVRGTDSGEVRWSEDGLQRLSVSALLRYRPWPALRPSRGEWQQGEYPATGLPLIERRSSAARLTCAFWAERPAVDAPPLPQTIAGVLADTALALLTLLSRRRALPLTSAPPAC